MPSAASGRNQRQVGMTFLTGRWAGVNTKGTNDNR